MTSAGAVIAIERRPTPASRTALARAVSYLAAIGYETTRIGPKGKWQARPTERQPDIVLLGTGDVGEVIAEVKRIHAAAPRARVLVAVDAVTTKAASRAYGAGATIVAPAGVFVAAMKNVVPRTGRVDERLRGWLNTKRADLDGRAPIDLLTGGSADALANYIRSVVAGEPG